MFGLEVIELAIGLVFTYLVLSLVCSGIFEVWSKARKLRSETLEKGLRKLLADADGSRLVNRIYDHYLIHSPFEDELGKPDHIAPGDFATAVFDVLVPTATDDRTRLEAIRAEIAKIPNEVLRKRLGAMLDTGQLHVASAHAMVSQWFDNSMQEVSKWYKRRSQAFVLGCSILVVLAFNADSLRVAQSLWNDDALRASLVSTAESYAGELEQDPWIGAPAHVRDVAGDDDALAQLEQSLTALQGRISDARSLPVGWHNEAMPWHEAYHGPHWGWFVALKLLGLALTVGAVSMGSSYWYTVLRKLLELASRRRATA